MVDHCVDVGGMQQIFSGVQYGKTRLFRRIIKTTQGVLTTTWPLGAVVTARTMRVVVLLDSGTPRTWGSEMTVSCWSLAHTSVCSSRICAWAVGGTARAIPAAMCQQQVHQVVP